MAISGAVLEGRRILIRGTVQGVGFRPWVYRVARQSGVTGRVHNDTAGVTIEAFGGVAGARAVRRTAARAIRRRPRAIRDFVAGADPGRARRATS